MTKTSAINVLEPRGTKLYELAGKKRLNDKYSKLLILAFLHISVLLEEGVIYKINLFFSPT